MTEEINYLKSQISAARAEIKNLRLLVYSMRNEHKKEITLAKTAINNLRCASCAKEATTSVTNSDSTLPQKATNTNSITFKPIGVIESSFQNKRAVPRQPNVLNMSVGAVAIDPGVFSNPEHALCGLEEFSHMWILFHFHMSESNGAVMAKVSPPRLRGERRGVFATRAPHRPCPIGLSLVKIQKIQGNKVYFLGVDMVSGTPVLDIKPFIPLYDYPAATSFTRPPLEGDSENTVTHSNIGAAMDSDDGTQIDGTMESVTRSLDDLLLSNTESPSSSEPNRYRHQEIQRGAPDGQERFTPPAVSSIHNGIRVAPWIYNPPAETYKVSFTDDALTRLVELIGDRAENFKANIECLLKEDPRSHYVRTKYGDHEYCCVLEDLSVSCIFDSDSLVCNIVAVRNAHEMQTN